MEELTIEDVIERYINSGLRHKKSFDENDVYIVIKEYYLNKMQQSSPIEINENAAISHLIRAAQKEKIQKEISDLVLGILEVKKDKIPITQIDSTEDLDEYMRKVAIIRLHQGRMPRECCEFIIKQAILEDGDVLKYKGMMERALEDFTEYELEEKKITDYYVAVTNQHFFRQKNSRGEHTADERMIKLSREHLITEKMIKLLETALHEGTHANQSFQIEKRKMNGTTYKMLKEDIIGTYDKEFYDENYENMYEEIHARENAYLKKIKILRRMGLTKDQIKKLGIGNTKIETLKFRQAYAIKRKI